MKILIACEFSGIVRNAFLCIGHDAISCDLLGNEEGHHYKGDVFDIINNGYDMMIAHPPCTYLCVSGNRWMKNNKQREKQRIKAIEFFIKLYNANIEKIAIENPVGVMSTKFMKPSQYIQPYEFGHPETKKTGLWLKNLPLLKSTDVVEPNYIIGKDGKKYSPIHYHTKFDKDRSKTRSVTYQGIADAMATQWGNK